MTLLRLITFNGKTQSLAAWAREVGIKYVTLKKRLNDGWPTEVALTTKTCFPRVNRPLNGGFIDITGQRFGRLLALRWMRAAPGEPILWECLCDCGNTCLKLGTCLRWVNTSSCGCLKAARPVHRLTYSTWVAARGRCRNPKSDEYHNYGGRGIQFSHEWDTYEAFVKDVGAHQQ
jgi:hypothetical protein